MPRKKTIWILAGSVCLLIAILVGVVFPAARRIRTFVVEDRIHGVYFPVAEALYSYQEENGRPADSLSALLPKYLKAIPSSEFTDAPTYRVLSDGQTWELSIRSRAFSQPRLYLCRSTQRLTPEEALRIMTQYHGTWAVFPSAM